MDTHAIRDLIETVMIVGGVVWGVAKFTSKVSLLERIPEQLSALDEKIDKVDTKVDTLTGAFEIYKIMGKHH